MRLPVQAGPIALIHDDHARRKFTRPQALKGVGSGSSCVDRCLASCPKDSIGGIEVACALNCFWICSGSRASGFGSLAATY
jgi:hypothetical protein